MNYEKLGEILKAGRANVSKSQLEISSILGVTSATVSSWERGKSRMDIETYIKLCSLYGLDPVSILKICSVGFSSLSDEVSPLSPEEARLVSGYRKLSPDGKSYIQQQMSIACTMFAGKNSAAPDMEAAN